MKRLFVTMLLAAVALYGCSGRSGSSQKAQPSPASTPSISSITPQFGWTNADTNITISGANFSPSAAVTFSPSGFAAGMSLTYVAFESSSQLQAVVPKGMAVGWYDVTAINPNGGEGTLRKSFYVSQNPPPVISGIAPASGSSNAATQITITGSYFASNATATTLDSTGSGLPCSISSQSSTQIVCTTQVLPTGVYLVRVTNTSDGTFYDFSSFVVTNPASNLGGFSTSSQSLIIGRQGLAAVTGNDDIGDRFIYAVGGDVGSGGKTLDSVEFDLPDMFGNLDPWQLTSPLIYKTTGAAAVQFNGYVYVLGGRTTSGYTAGIERAKILTTDSAPVITFNGLTVLAGGSLPSGTWVYAVSANLPTGTTNIGESLPSPVVFTTTASTGSIQLSWPAVKVWNPVSQAFVNATGYNVYRNVAGSFRPVLIAWNVPSTGFTDNGKYAPIRIMDTTSGFPEALQDPVITDAVPSSTGGTLSPGTYNYSVSAVNDRGETAALDTTSVTTTSNTSTVTLTFSAVPGAEYYRVYRSPYPGAGRETLLMPVVLDTTITDDGSVLPVTTTTMSGGYILPLPYGSLGPFRNVSVTLSAARGYLGAAVGHTQTGTVYGYAVGGTSDGSTGLGTVDVMQLTASPITSASPASGSLAASTYTYAVTALTPDGELPNAGTFVTSVSTGGIQLAWQSVPGASSYNVYRDTGSGLQYIAHTANPVFTDNGSFSPVAGSRPVGGGIGPVAPTSALLAPRFQPGVLCSDKSNLPLAVTDSSGYLYVAGGYNAGVQNTIEVSRIQGDGSLEPFTDVQKNTNTTPQTYAITGAVFLQDSNNYMYIFGGYSTHVTQAVQDFDVTPTPYKMATNANGAGLLSPRYLGGGVLLGPYFYFIGGTGNGTPSTLSSDTVLNSVEQVIY